MSTFHYTDSLGQAVEEARAGAEKAAGAFGLLEQELVAERESHRTEVLRLVERAEDAETRVAMLVGQLNAASASEGDARTRAVELEAKLATAEERAAERESLVAELREAREGEHVERLARDRTIAVLRDQRVELERRLATVRDDYRQARERITELEDQRTR